MQRLVFRSGVLRGRPLSGREEHRDEGRQAAGWVFASVASALVREATTAQFRVQAAGGRLLTVRGG